MTKFVKESDKRGTYIIEGDAKPGGVFSIKRFICQVQEQQTPEETQEVADLLVKKLNRK
ncbi:MAG: hypothetical protein HEP71_34215 [Roseivirga sp.]|nr:hypothetical protein [Roseivirga sp.]